MPTGISRASALRRCVIVTVRPRATARSSRLVYSLRSVTLTERDDFSDLGRGWFKVSTEVGGWREGGSRKQLLPASPDTVP